MSVYRGLEEAAKSLGWQIHLEDGRGQKAVQSQILNRVIANHPDGLVFGGFDPDDFAEQLGAARKEKIVLMGWHAAKEPGPTKDLFFNVSTRPSDVAKVAANFVIWDAIAKQRPVGVVIFNDDQFAVANVKAEVMAKTIQACAGYHDCKVLSVQNVKISNAATAMPPLVSQLDATYGKAWSYSLAINDVYLDEINYPLIALKRTDIRHVSAGDGSLKAKGRIQAGLSQQIATVAEPLKLQGYQLADEFNRAFAQDPPSGYQSTPILVTTQSLREAGSAGIEADLHFEEAYKSIWKRK